MISKNMKQKDWKCHCIYTPNGEPFGKCLRCVKMELKAVTRQRFKLVNEIKEWVKENSHYYGDELKTVAFNDVEDYLEKLNIKK